MADRKQWSVDYNQIAVGAVDGRRFYEADSAESVNWNAVAAVSGAADSMLYSTRQQSIRDFLCIRMSENVAWTLWTELVVNTLWTDVGLCAEHAKRVSDIYVYKLTCIWRGLLLSMLLADITTEFFDLFRVVQFIHVACQ